MTREEEYLSSILWGAVGYIARSAHLGIPYIAQPNRRRFLSQTPFFRRPDAVSLTLGKIDRAHAERFAAIEREASIALGLVIPPLLVDIIGDAKDRDDLLTVALQRRAEYRELRRWLAYFQQAIRDRDVDRMLEYQATIKKCADLATSPEYAGVHRYSVVSRVIDEMPGFHRRAALIMDKLMLARAGEDMMGKLLRFFEVAGTSLEPSVSTAAGRMNHHAEPYVLLDGTVIAESWTDLTDGELAGKIRVDEYGAQQVKTNGAWTGTTAGGELAGPTCEGWIKGDEHGTAGDLDALDAKWSSAGQVDCEAEFALICIEQ